MKKVIILLTLLNIAVLAQQQGSFTDTRDKKTYKTVKIGEQTWMAENLNYASKGGKCYGNNHNNCEKYGRLYNWDEAIEACPDGWHLPSDEEWDTLVNFAGGDKVAGKKLKAKTGWSNNKLNQSENSFVISGGGMDDYGFSALPGGRSSGNKFEMAGNIGSWWTATQSDTKNVYMRTLRHDYSNEILKGTYNKSIFFSVRCVKGAAAFAQDPAIADLKTEAKKWQDEPDSFRNARTKYFNDECNPNENPCDYYQEMEIEGRFFSFKKRKEHFIASSHAYRYIWSAISKMKIGDCPAKSVWVMEIISEHGTDFRKSITPPKCKSITPKEISNFNSADED